jgi:hypothetical protein
MNRPAGYWDSKTVLAERGRLSLLWEPRDMWLGVFWGKGSVYVVLVPCFPVRIRWRG